MLINGINITEENIREKELKIVFPEDEFKERQEVVINNIKTLSVDELKPYERNNKTNRRRGGQIPRGYSCQTGRRAGD